jgi:RNA-splicing ligase RtcB
MQHGGFLPAVKQLANVAALPGIVKVSSSSGARDGGSTVVAAAAAVAAAAVMPGCIRPLL